MRELSDQLRADGFRNECWKLMGRLAESINRPDLAIGSYREALARDVHDEETRARIRQLAASAEPKNQPSGARR